MLCGMMGKGFGITESRVGPVPLTHASNSSDGANYTAQLGGCVLACSWARTRYVTQVCRPLHGDAPPGTSIRVKPVTQAAFGQPGGLPEVQFPFGTGPGTVSGPTPIR